MNQWWKHATVYHLYPFGYCNAAHRNDFSSPGTDRILQLTGCLDNMDTLGCDTLLLGPVFESTSHGYDTVDFWHIDRRLGNNALFTELVRTFHEKGKKVVLDGVFHHTGRDFWAFYQLKQEGEHSRYREWFSGVDFSRPGQRNDGFSYDNWEGHDDLVKLNLEDPGLREHIFGAVGQMIDIFGIDGLRLDVAYALDPRFTADLAAFCRRLKPDFWLLGEVIHGDYGRFMEPGQLDSVTNYEVYKAIWSSILDTNYFELSWACTRQFGEDRTGSPGVLYNFVDNHDVTRLASRIPHPAELRLAYAVMFMLPGIPSVYYGSEQGIKGEKLGHDDWALRPSREDLTEADPDLRAYIGTLSRLRRSILPLTQGVFKELFVANEHFAFLRLLPQGGSCALCLFNLGTREFRAEEIQKGLGARLHENGVQGFSRCFINTREHALPAPDAGRDQAFMDLPPKSWALYLCGPGE
ncbi:MAG: alpha amylase catalytic subunit [Spirochaetales bacterium]|nr:alpha amylase catalytic subunit [Spirochaetales bacterium]